MGEGGLRKADVPLGDAPLVTGSAVDTDCGPATFGYIIC